VPGDKVVQQLERALMLARNDKLKYFVGVFVTEKEQLTELIGIQEGQTYAAIGACYTLLKDVSNKVDQVNWDDYEGLEEPDEPTSPTVSNGEVVQMSDTMRRAMTDTKPGWAWQYRPID